jgi:uncharacterized protein DUF4383
MKKIYLVLGAALMLLGAAVFRNYVHVAVGAATLIAATQPIGRIRTWGKVAGLAYLALAIAALASPNLFGWTTITRPDAITHLAAAAIFLYVALLAPPKP